MKATQAERWRPVVGYEGRYEVSDLGRARRLDIVAREARRTYLRKGSVLAQNLGSNGRYFKVELNAAGDRRTAMVHSLVAEAFLGPRPRGMEVCHNNGDSFDNRASNLRYDTPSANHLDTVRHGHHYQVEKTHCKQGHPYDDANTRHSKRGRECKACGRAWTAKYKAKLKVIT